MFKVNSDAYVPNDSIVGLGFVVRNGRGEIVLMGVKRIKASWSMEEAEAAPMLFSLQMTIDVGYDKIVLENDSLEWSQNSNQERGVWL